MIINNLNWAQVNDAIEIFENKALSSTSQCVPIERMVSMRSKS